MDSNEKFLSFEEFANIWKEKFGDQNTNIWETYKKFKDFPKENLSKYLDSSLLNRKMTISNENNPERFAPLIKPNDYIESIINKIQENNLKLDLYPIDEKKTLYLMVYIQGEKTSMNTCFFQLKVSEKSNDDGNLSLFQAFKNFSKDKLQFSFPTNYKDFALVKSEENLNPVLYNIVLPSFISKLKNFLNIDELKEELIIVPLAKNLLYATKSSSYLGCCMLGDYTNSEYAHKSIPEWVSSVPYMIKSIQESAPEMDLIKQGILPIKWEIYPSIGKEPRIGIENKGKIFFSIPSSDAQVKSFLERSRNTIEKPAVFKILVREGNNISGYCSFCHQFANKLMKCGKCLNLYYCSKYCQTKDWKDHKMICRK